MAALNQTMIPMFPMGSDHDDENVPDIPDGAVTDQVDHNEPDVAEAEIETNQYEQTNDCKIKNNNQQSPPNQAENAPSYISKSTVSNKNDYEALLLHDTDPGDFGTRNRTKQMNYKWKYKIIASLIICILLIIIILIIIISSKSNSTKTTPFVDITGYPTFDPTITPTISPSINSNPAIPTYSPPINATNHPSLKPSQSPSLNPTENPSSNPTTPAPTDQGELLCGDSDTGDYNGQPLIFKLHIPHPGDFTINAGGSSFNVTKITATQNDSVIGTVNMDILTIINIPSGDYNITIEAAGDITTRTYYITTLCKTYSPTSAPTYDPTKSPTPTPTYDPTQTPTNDPTPAPTQEPSAAPTDAPTSAPTANPSKHLTPSPTDNPTSAPTANPFKHPTPSPTDNPTSAPTLALPIPGEWTPIDGTNDSLTVNASSSYIDHYQINECIMNTDENNQLLNNSYITMLYNDSIDFQDSNFLIVSTLSIGILPLNCTQFPALRIIDTEIYTNINDQQQYIKLFVIKAQFWEYLETLDVNMSNITITNNTQQFTPSDETMATQVIHTNSSTNNQTITYDTVPIDCDDMTYSECIDYYSNFNNSHDIKRRLIDIKWSPSVTLSINPTFKKKITASDFGSGIGLDIEAGFYFYAKFTSSFECKWSLWKGFEKFKFITGFASAINAYLNIILNDIKFELKILRISMDVCFAVGPIPICLEFYVEQFMGFEACNLGLTLKIQLGYEPIEYQFGVEYTKNHGWKSIAHQTNDFQFIHMFKMYQNTSKSCHIVSEPSIRWNIGFIFEELVDQYISVRYSEPMTLAYPMYGCGDNASLLSEYCPAGTNKNYYVYDYESDVTLYYGIQVIGDKIANIELDHWVVRRWKECVLVPFKISFDKCCGETAAPITSISCRSIEDTGSANNYMLVNLMLLYISYCLSKL